MKGRGECWGRREGGGEEERAGEGGRGLGGRRAEVRARGGEGGREELAASGVRAFTFTPPAGVPGQDTGGLGQKGGRCVA